VLSAYDNGLLRLSMPPAPFVDSDLSVITRALSAVTGLGRAARSVEVRTKSHFAPSLASCRSSAMWVAMRRGAEPKKTRVTPGMRITCRVAVHLSRVPLRSR
jgi:hypothetical protein